MVNRYFTKAGLRKISYELPTSFKKMVNSYLLRTFVINITSKSPSLSILVSLILYQPLGNLQLKSLPHDFQKVRKQKKIFPQKKVYKILLKEIFVPPTAENKILRHGFSHETIHKVYELPFQIKNDIKITMFQYKIIHNILTTKVSLFRAKICDNNICPQCLIEILSLDQMLLRCASTIAFWKTFQNWWANKTEQYLTLSNSMILYGVYDKMKQLFFKLCASNCKIFNILQLPTPRKTLF